LVLVQVNVGDVEIVTVLEHMYISPTLACDLCFVVTTAGRQGAVCDKPPYVEPGIFTTDWGLSSQPSQGEEDIANLTEDDWTAQMEAVR
jgi:hypothetical protein